MTQIEKLIKKFTRQPDSIHGRDLEKIILHNGYQKVRQTGSHCIYKKPHSPDINLPMHHGDCKTIYKRKTKHLLYPST